MTILLILAACGVLGAIALRWLRRFQDRQAAERRWHEAHLWLHRRMARLAPEVGAAPQIVQSEEVQACAFCDDGGAPIVCVTTGLLDVMPPQALNFVLAHELAHHLKGHLTVRATTDWLAGTVLEAIRPQSLFEQLGLTDDPAEPYWHSALRVGADAALQAQSRSQEFEADAVAVDLLRRTRLSPRGASTALEILGQYSGQAGVLQEVYLRVFGSHPLLADRLDRVRALVGTPSHPRVRRVSGQPSATESYPSA